MATRSKRHTHKYHKIDLRFGRVWACALPDCLHYMPQHMENMVIGKSSYCWQCGNEMILDPENMKEDKPRCHSCISGIKPDDDVEIAIDNRMQELINKIR